MVIIIFWLYNEVKKSGSSSDEDDYHDGAEHEIEYKDEGAENGGCAPFRRDETRRTSFGQRNDNTPISQMKWNKNHEG